MRLWSLQALARGFASSSVVRRGTTKNEWAVGDYHPAPIGESDVSQQTTMNPLSKERLGNRLIISSWSETGFTISGNKVFGPIALFPSIVLSWRVSSPSAIAPDSLEFFSILEPKPDLVLIGVGDLKDVDPVRKRVAPFLKENRLPFEVLTSEHAIHTFNFANGDGRYVTAALYPPKHIVLNSETRINYHEDIAAIEWDGGVDLTEPPKDLFEKLWGGDFLRQSEEARKAALQKKIQEVADRKNKSQTDSQ